MEQFDSINKSSILNKTSFFIDFVGNQDEVVDSLFINQSSDYNTIKQVKLSTETNTKKSLFTNHQLQIVDRNPIEHITKNQDFVLVILIICIILVSISKTISNKGLSNNLKSVFAFRQFSMSGFEVHNKRISLFLFINYILSFSLFIFAFVSLYPQLPFNIEPDFSLFLKIISGVLLIYAYKYIFINSIGKIFKTDNQTSNYKSIIYYSSQAMGILLLPMVIVIVYLNSLTFFYITGGIYLIYYVYRIFRSQVSKFNKSEFSLFHLFLYLCTLEILPLFVLIKFAETINTTI
ncbi:MAG: DUF4271 domain-containing protein [Saprospiraceae bacterium]|nr:DUF4271 domain-containing protein [Saprospiraceae bacterium]